VNVTDPREVGKTKKYQMLSRSLSVPQYMETHQLTSSETEAIQLIENPDPTRYCLKGIQQKTNCTDRWEAKRKEKDTACRCRTEEA
jgi:hypothetical protein